jgi:putative oxidoreductase
MNTLNMQTAGDRRGFSHMLRQSCSRLVAVLEWLQAPALLTARLYVAYVFFMSGVESLRSWDATLYLYESEFHVAVLPPHVAAVMGTFGEVLLPPLLALGLFGRFGALGLFVVNAVALLSYMYALQAPAIMFHVIWGILLIVVALWGPGKWSADHLWASWRAARAGRNR